MKNQTTLCAAIAAILIAGFAPLKAGPIESFTLLPGTAITGDAGTTIGWGIEIDSPNYDLVVDSVQTSFEPYPFGLSADDNSPGNPVFTDYLSAYFFNYNYTVLAGTTFEQDFSQGTPGGTGTGLGAFTIRSDAAPSAEEDATVTIVYDLYTSGGTQVDSYGNPTYADLSATLPATVQVTAALETPPGPLPTPEPSPEFLAGFSLLAGAFLLRRTTLIRGTRNR